MEFRSPANFRRDRRERDRVV
ncbi:uncharacterized protein G2W53_001729 [Senna tora]|uniref:Uncharacterized protein n=1 Tax=Senna tora TaxID=362788 RepID=A0A834XGH6_9FABA|nr:uncharacterized protein G2W53_001729 [Senna tora]